MNLFKRITRKIGIILCLNYVGLYQKKFYATGGDKKNRYNYKLKKGSIVFDLGSFRGEFLDNVYNKNNTYYLFEINLRNFNFLKEKYKNYKNVYIFPYGLGPDNLKGFSSGDGAGGKFLNNKKGQILIRKFDDFCKSNKIRKIELLKINIEGAEYDLVKFLDHINFLSNINYIQVQPHDFEENSLDLILENHRLLSKTHDLDLSYPFVWDFWSLK